MDVKLVIREPIEGPTISQSWIFLGKVAILYSLSRCGSFEISGTWLNSISRRSARIRPFEMSIIILLSKGNYKIGNNRR